VAAGLVAGVLLGVTGPGPDIGTIPTVAVVSAPVPELAWPSQGEAAVAVGLVNGFRSQTHSEGGSAPVPIASLAKMMTAWLTLAEHPMVLGQSGFIYTVTAADVADYRARVAQGQSTLAVATGEHLSEYQLLEGMLIPSGNNAAAILGRYDAGGDPPNFLNEMNFAARLLGLTHTHYTDPSGLDPRTVSTAADQVRMAEIVMANPVFAHIVDTASVTLPVAGTVHNFDTLLGKDGFVGIKNGSDREARGCFVFADNKSIGGRSVTIYGVVLGQAGGPRTSFTTASLEAGQSLSNSVANMLTFNQASFGLSKALLGASNTSPS
jgi:D-alanyl-D-alanine carboxypeptidase (penicillin-binding protein 5/6)